MKKYFHNTKTIKIIRKTFSKFIIKDFLYKTYFKSNLTLFSFRDYLINNYGNNYKDLLLMEMYNNKNLLIFSQKNRFYRICD